MFYYADMNELPLPYKYKDGIRCYLEDGNEMPETLPCFLERMKVAEDVLFADIERAEAELPIFDDCKKDRRDLRSALEGIAAGGKMLVVTSKAGFQSWSHFENHALCRCQAARKLYNLAKDERKNRKLFNAEEALHERAVEGVDEPIVNHLGQIVGYKKKYSDRLLEVQLKALDPDTYSDKNKNENKGLVINVEMGLREKMKDADIVEFTGLDIVRDEDKEED
jgi:hypothetical protein|tara:strand:+ start:8368 stop:9036 length:669 start_codon:yes stop_codon:yes gene_type:complete